MAQQQEHYDSRQNPKKATTSHLNREDFDGGPVSIDQIEKGLYLGTFNETGQFIFISSLLLFTSTKQSVECWMNILQAT